MPINDMVTPTSIFARRESEARSYCRGVDEVFTRASGAELFDAEGNRYIDFLAGCSSLNYGHNDADMKAALIEHISRDGVAHGLDFHTDAKSAFLKAFESKILGPRKMDYKVMMTGPTGTNAVEAAIKLARKVTGRRNVISFTNGFHGMTMGALALTGNASKRGGAGNGSLADVTHMPFEGSLGEDVLCRNRRESLGGVFGLCLRAQHHLAHLRHHFTAWCFYQFRLHPFAVVEPGIRPANEFFCCIIFFTIVFIVGADRAIYI